MKLIRKLIGGTWFKITTVDGKKAYWTHPTCPIACEILFRDRIVAKEFYSPCRKCVECSFPEPCNNCEPESIKWLN